MSAGYFAAATGKGSTGDHNKHAKNVIINNYHLNRIWANIIELEKRRQALITWIGRQLNLPQEEIENLRLNSQYEIMLAALDNAIQEPLRSRYGQPPKNSCISPL